MNNINHSYLDETDVIIYANEDCDDIADDVEEVDTTDDVDEVDPDVAEITYDDERDDAISIEDMMAQDLLAARDVGFETGFDDGIDELIDILVDDEEELYDDDDEDEEDVEEGGILDDAFIM